MDGLIMAAQLITALSILVLVHEWGHFIAARIFGIKIEKFFIFFDAGGFKLFSFKRGDTEYGMGWLPLGGYVKISGMIDESFDKEQMKKPPEPWEFRSKPAWQRLIVMVAGVFMNVILGILVFAMLMFFNGKSYIPNSEVKHGIVALDLGQEIGLQTGDKIVAVNGEEVERFGDILSSDIVLSDNSVLTVVRNGEYIDIPIPENFAKRVAEREEGLSNFISIRVPVKIDSVLPGSNAELAGMLKGDSITAINDQPVTFMDEFRPLVDEHKGQEVQLSYFRDGRQDVLTARVDTASLIGFAAQMPGVAFEKFGFFQSFSVGAKTAVAALWDTMRGLGKVISGDIPANKAVQGPIGIATQFGAHWDWLRFWTLTGILSMVLAFMNILPIPALDGGHVILLFAEMIRGKALSQKFMEVTQVIGVVIILILMVLIFSNDIFRLVSG
ncbi:MAG: RIP metalloprotease RseP [Bacteroidia bacterium]